MLRTRARKPRCLTWAVILPCPEGHFRGKSYTSFRTLLWGWELSDSMGNDPQKSNINNPNINAVILSAPTPAGWFALDQPLDAQIVSWRFAITVLRITTSWFAIYTRFPTDLEAIWVAVSLALCDNRRFQIGAIPICNLGIKKTNTILEINCSHWLKCSSLTHSHNRFDLYIKQAVMIGSSFLKSFEQCHLNFMIRYRIPQIVSCKWCNPITT